MVNKTDENRFRFCRDDTCAARYGRAHFAFRVRIKSYANRKLRERPAHLLCAVADDDDHFTRAAFQKITDAGFDHRATAKRKQRLKRPHTTAATGSQ